jgi:hypothetical protein
VTTLRGSWRAGPVTALVARAEAWLLEPSNAGVDPASDSNGRLTPGGEGQEEPLRVPPVVAVVGLGRGVGGTTVARALAGRLARSDPSGAAILFSEGPAPRPALAARSAAGLAEQLGELGCDGARTAGRLVLAPASEPLAPVAAERPAAIVVDIRHGEGAAPALAIADHAALVARPDVEAALVATVERSLRAGGIGVTLVMNRSLGEPDDGRAVPIAESRLAARAALACRGPRGAFAAPIAELAERCLAEAGT